MARSPAAAAPAAEERKGDVVLFRSGTSGLPAIDDRETQGLVGLGYSEKAEDSLVPIVSLLQEGSGEVKRNHPKQMQGAIAGNHLIIRSLKKLIDVSETPLPVIPCGFTHHWVEWEGEPGEGTVVAQYPFEERPAEAKEVPDPQNDKRNNWIMPSGTRLVDTRYHYCLAHIDDSWMPVVIPMGGTNHTVSRTWTSQQKLVRLPSGAKAPSWFMWYNFSTQFNSRGSQSWYTYDIDPGGWVPDRELRDEGRKIFESLQQGIIEPDVVGEAGRAAEEHHDDPV